MLLNGYSSLSFQPSITLSESFRQETWVENGRDRGESQTSSEPFRHDLIITGPVWVSLLGPELEARQRSVNINIKDVVLNHYFIMIKQYLDCTDYN